MDTRYMLGARRRARGAARPIILAVVAVIVLLAAASWFLIFRPHQELVAADAGGHPSTPVTVGHAAAPPVNVEAMSVNQLLAEASKAMKEQRYLAPEGNNAFEFYLKVLQKQPGNQVASDALRETFPFAASAAEQTINQRNFDEAQREIDLLSKADPTNFTLTILRSKLDAQRKTLDQEQQKQLDQQHQQQLAAQKAAADKAAAEKLAQQQAAAEAAKRQQALAAQQQAQQQATAAPAPESAAPASAGATRDAVLTRQVNPRYPTSAQRAGIEGWVEVDFTVDVEGDVRDAKVAEAQPRHVFDRSALEAVNRWKFEPAMRDGKPVASQLRRRIQFKLRQ
ncbi:energy transducer TonB [Fulvimonas sp. R45]|uniref:energy transducer TonB n=1 Tax=Fulvimonas sp. R45 TaxID=3045937 RepID=UPI00265D8B0D|nr:energy transducer TonB [Fulvimonas sp. R45]MDO1527656.1 energy transducer TonB [Fulvimonas sp. R45]